jgi:hypothetical protein
MRITHETNAHQPHHPSLSFSHTQQRGIYTHTHTYLVVQATRCRGSSHCDDLYASNQDSVAKHYVYVCVHRIYISVCVCVCLSKVMTMCSYTRVPARPLASASMNAIDRRNPEATANTAVYVQRAPQYIEISEHVSHTQQEHAYTHRVQLTRDQRVVGVVACARPTEDLVESVVLGGALRAGSLCAVNGG